MGIGLTASSASNFKMNRLPGKINSILRLHSDDSISLLSILTILLFFVDRMGQTVIWLSWRWWQLLLLIREWTKLWTDFHNKWCHWMWRKLRQHMLLHEKWPSSWNCISRFATEALSDCWSADSRRDCRCKFWSKTICIRYIRYDWRITCFHSSCDIFIPFARWSGRLDSDYAKVSNLHR